MEKISHKSLLLLSLGVFVIAASFILPHFIAIEAFSRGLIVGTGIGLIIKSDFISIS